MTNRERNYSKLELHCSSKRMRPDRFEEYCNWTIAWFGALAAYYCVA